jgi:hypothetical protein
MPESKTDVLIWNGSQKNFTTSEDKVFEHFLDGNGGRITQQWYMNSGASITEHNLEEFGRTPWNTQRLIVGIKKADEDAYTDAFWTAEYAESWREVHSDSFYAWLTTHTSDAFASPWVPPVGGAPSRHTSTWEVHATGAHRRGRVVPRRTQAAEQAAEAMPSRSSSRGRRCAGRRAGAHRRCEDAQPLVEVNGSRGEYRESFLIKLTRFAC